MAISDFDIAFSTRVQSDENTAGGTLPSGAAGATVEHTALVPPLANSGQCRAYSFREPSGAEDSVSQVKILVADKAASDDSAAPKRLVSKLEKRDVEHKKAISLRAYVRLDRASDVDAADSTDNALALVGLTSWTTGDAAKYSGGYELFLQAQGSGAQRSVKLVLRAGQPQDFSEGHASLLGDVQIFCSGTYALGQWYHIRLDVVPVGSAAKRLVAYTSADDGATWSEVGSLKVSQLSARLWREPEQGDPARNGLIVLRSGEASGTELYKHFFASFEAFVESVDENIPPDISVIPEAATVTNASVKVPVTDAVGGKEEDEFLFFSATQTDGSPLPSWLTIDTSTGQLSGIAPQGSDGIVNVRVSVEDERGAVSTRDIAVRVQPEESAPAPAKLATPGVAQGATANTVVGALSSTDPLGSTVTHSIVAGAGDDSFFTVQDGQLVLSQDVPADRESLSVWVKTQNESGFYTQKQITIPLAPSSDQAGDNSGYQSLIGENEGEAGSDFIFIPLTPPTISYNDTSNGWSVTNDPSYSVSAPATGAVLEYSLDDTTWSTTQPVVQEGLNTIYVRQTSGVGSSNSSSITFTLDTAAPVVTSGSTANVVALDLVSDNTVYTVTTDIADEPISITIREGADQFFSVSGNTITAGTLVEGQDVYTFSISVKDRAQNETIHPLTVNVDNTGLGGGDGGITPPPGDGDGDGDGTITDPNDGVTTPDDGDNTVIDPGAGGDLVDPNAENPVLATPTVALDQDTSGGSLITSNPAYTVSYVDPEAVVEYSLDNSTWVTSKPVLQEGANTVYVRQTKNGEVSPTATFSCTLDTVVPTITSGDTGSLNLTTAALNNDYLVYTATASESVTLQFVNGTGTGFTISGMTVVADTNITLGTYQLDIQASDAANNQSLVKSISVAVTSDGVLNPGGDGSIESPPGDGDGDGGVVLDPNDGVTSPDDGDNTVINPGSDPLLP